MALDQGTTGTTALVVEFDGQKGQVIGRSTENFSQHSPKQGWVEHDLDEIWETVKISIQNAIAQSNISTKSIKAIGITNQRETLCVFNRKDGQPLRKAIVWQCRRSSSICEKMKHDETSIKKKTGLLLDPYFTGTKLTWIHDHEPEIYNKLQTGEALASTIDAWLVYKLTAGQVFATEPSNASRTLLMDLETCQWNEDLLEKFKVPRQALPEIYSSQDNFGMTTNMDILPDGIPILGVLGDQQAALLGQGAVQPGDMKCTYGTGAFLLMNVGNQIRFSNHNLLTTVAWRVGGETTYALEGSSFIAGAAFQYLRDELLLVKDVKETANLASSEQAAPDVYFVPALTGLGAPYWNPSARGAFLGLTRGSSKNQLIRATLEGVAFSVEDLLASMEKDAQPLLIENICVDGGAASNALLMQLQADISNKDVDCSEQIESTGIGASYIAALGAGVVSNIHNLKHLRQSSKVFHPVQSSVTVAKWKMGWAKAVEAVQVFAG